MSVLAINGGTPLIPEGITPEWPIFDEREKAQIIEVLDSGKWCALGQPDGKVTAFEKAFAGFIGTKFAMAVPNGTAALEVALTACGIEPGDEVIVPAVTFIASASAIVLAGGVPVFVDVEPDTYQISADAVEEAITSRTKAIEVVHYGGYPADMDRIMEIAGKHGLSVVEDAAEAHGSEWRGKRTGSIGDMGGFSFQMGKALTCGEGGCMTFSDENLAAESYAYARLGRKQGGEAYEHYVPAGNYRLSEFLGAILLIQLERFPAQLETRHENGEYFAAELAKIEGVSALKRDERITKRGYYFYFVRFDEKLWNGIPRDRFLEALKAEGVRCGTAHNQPLYLNPAFENIKKSLLYGSKMNYADVHCPVGEYIYSSEVVAMGKDFLMERDNVDMILEAIRKIRANIGELAG